MNNNFELQGTIIHIGEERVYSEKFKTIDFVISFLDGAYEQTAKFQLVNDRCDLINVYNTGDEVKVSFNVRGRAYEKETETIYFTNLVAWRIQKVDTEQNDDKPLQKVNVVKDSLIRQEDNDEDLPF